MEVPELSIISIPQSLTPKAQRLVGTTLALPSRVKLTPTLLKLIAGLVLVAVITFGKSAAFAGQAGHSFTASGSKPSGAPLIAAATLAVGVAGFRRKG